MDPNANNTRIEPRVGRTLDFWPNGRSGHGDQPCCAQIAYVNPDGTLNIGYLAPSGVHAHAQQIRLLQAGEPEPSAGPFCEWMPYQIGQARQGSLAGAGAGAAGGSLDPDGNPGTGGAPSGRAGPRR